MPPVLDVALDELPAGAQQQLLAQQLRLAVHQRHRVLQLIAEAESAAGLVVAAARPQATGDRLVQQPAVGQQVQGTVRRLDLDRAERAAPVLLHRVERLRASGRSAKPLHQLIGLVDAATHAEAEHDLARFFVGQVERHLDRRARVERRPDPTRPSRTRLSAAGWRNEPLRPMNSVRSQVKLPAARCASSTSKKPIQSP
jgi:hypothetical protein